MPESNPPHHDAARIQQIASRLDDALEALESAPKFAKTNHQGRILDYASRLLATPEGTQELAARAGKADRAGVFAGTDWDMPSKLQPKLVASSIESGCSHTLVLEALSELRLLAIAKGDYEHPRIDKEKASELLREVMALNMDFVLQRETEETRQKRLRGIRNAFALLTEHFGFSSILEQVVEEAWSILRQRPINVTPVVGMITRLSICLANSEYTTEPKGAWRLICALYGPTHETEGDPGTEAYREQLAALDQQKLLEEAGGFSRAMHDTGLVSPYHPVLLHFLLDHQPSLLSSALGLSSTGHDVLLTYRELVHTLIRESVFPETAQGVYGLARMLERGILYTPPLAPALWRQIQLKLRPDVADKLALAKGPDRPAKAHLLSDLLCMLGLPFGIGQGDNPTCQSARALSMWAYNDPDFLLQLLAWAARDGELVMNFEGQRISSLASAERLDPGYYTSLDAVSLVVVPHLDRIYQGMAHFATGRGEDPHKWINPEFHGWWVGRAFSIAVDVNTGKLQNYEAFLRDFYAAYHPFYNGNQPVIHPQPAGVAATDSHGRFVGWHAITIIRIALDQTGRMRAYFFNPNNDSRQNWGGGVVVSTEGNGEFFGESSLPFGEFASRVYIYHYDELERGDPLSAPAEEIAGIQKMAMESWAKDRT